MTDWATRVIDNWENEDDEYLCKIIHTCDWCDGGIRGGEYYFFDTRRKEYICEDCINDFSENLVERIG